MAVVQRVHPLPKGWRVNRSYANHSNLPRAIDYGAPIGTPVFAAQNGVVETAVNLTTSYGTHVVLKHAGGAKTIYAHMIRGSLRVKTGDVVRAGTQLGKLGATGNADGAHLHFEVRGPGGGTIDPAVWLAGASNVGESSDQTGVGGQTTVDEKVYPLPKPQRRQPDSGLAMPFLGSGNLSLLNDDLTASVAQLIDSVRLDASTATVAQLTLVSHDPDLALSKSKLADIGATVKWQFGGLTSLWDISTVDVEAAESLVTIVARSMLAKRLRRRVKVRSARKVTPSEWVKRVVEGAGGNAVVQKSSQRGEIAQGDGVSEWDMISDLAGSLDWSWVEWGGVVLFGSRHWAWSGGAKTPLWEVTWGDSPRTDALDVSLSQTSDDPDNTAVGTIVLPWNRGIQLQPWHCLQLSGLGRWDGTYLVESVSATTDGISAVEVQVAVPTPPAPDTGTKSTSSATRNDTPPTRDKTSVKYAKWFARQEMAKGKYGWGSDDQWAALEQLWTRESGWNYKAENPSSGAYGIPQSLPGSKMATAGKDWRTNPETQIRWGLDYIKARYGGPKRAWAFFQANNWY